MDFERKIIVEQILKELRNKNALTDIEKDILSTWNVYIADPFDRADAELKIVENNGKYKEIYMAIRCSKGIYPKPFEQASESEMKNNLFMQIEMMCIKDGLKVF